jgi:hypothetical protein
MRFLKYLKHFVADLLRFAWENKAWWIVPLVLILVFIAFVIFSGQSLAPLMYPLF